MPALRYTVVHVGLSCFTLKSCLSESPLHSSLKKIVFQVLAAGTWVFHLWLPLVTQKIYSLFLFVAGSKAVGLLFKEES